MEEFYMYQYHFIDDHRFIRPAEVVLAEDGYSPAEINKQIKDIKKAFKRDGWEGDGEIGIIWLPPFFDDQDYLGKFLWHVKQSNNGTSFIASPCEIPFGFLGSSDKRGDMSATVQHDTKNFIKDLKKIRSSLKKEIKCLNNLGKSEIRESIRQKILVTTHDSLISSLIYILDRYYLNLLQERYINHNTKVKINKNRVNFKDIKWEDDFNEERDYHKLFRTSLYLISSIWHSFLSSSLDDKFDTLFHGVKYSMDKDKLDLIKTHVSLRNAIHHEEGVLTLKVIEKLKLNVLPSGTTLKKGDKIIFLKEDLFGLILSLIEFANDFSRYVYSYFITGK